MLLLLDLLDNININLQDVSNDVWWRERKPLSQRDICNTITLVELDPDKLLGLRGILDIMTRVIRENSSVAGSEVKGTSVRRAKEDSSSSLALMEVKPLLSLKTD